MRDTDRSGGTSGTCKTNRSIRTDKYRYRHFERTPRTTTPSPRRGGVVPFAKRDDCNTEATDSAISFARMSEIYLRRNFHESPKTTPTPASRDESEIEPEIKGFRLSVGHRHTAIRSTAPRDLHAAGPPRNPPYGEIPAPAAIPARPAPEQYPATSCAEKLRPDETKIQKRQPTA